MNPLLVTWTLCCSLKWSLYLVADSISLWLRSLLLDHHELPYLMIYSANNCHDTIHTARHLACRRQYGIPNGPELYVDPKISTQHRHSLNTDTILGAATLQKCHQWGLSVAKRGYHWHPVRVHLSTTCPIATAHHSWKGWGSGPKCRPQRAFCDICLCLYVCGATVAHYRWLHGRRHPLYLFLKELSTVVSSREDLLHL